MDVVGLGMVGLILFGPGADHASWAQEQPIDDSAQRLIKKIKGLDSQNVMVRVVEFMNDAQKRLGEFFDVGPQTQEIQLNILKELDLAITAAKQNTKMIKSSSAGKTDAQQEGQTEQSDSTDQAGGPDGPSAADTAQSGGDGDKIDVGRTSHLRERLRQWGNLPARDRAEILQGLNEDVSEKYRRQIDRYYESLAQPQQ